MTQSKRFKLLSERPINQEAFVHEWPEVGLIVSNSPDDPKPSLSIGSGQVLEMDGTPRERMDMLDLFIADHAIDRDMAQEAMSTPSETIARMLVDINVPRSKIIRLIGGCTAAKLVEIVGHMNVLEMMMALGKMRLRRTPANQAHVTNRRENPALLAADAAEAALRGFAENETTVGIARAAPLNALCIMVGSQVGRGGVLTQCAVEEGVNLRLGFKGLTSYAETLSVYGTEGAFVDGDDTPWSKAFLASAYASRGVKIRFTSGTGSEALMGHAEGRSMLYLEARCLLVTRAAGSQGVQNGSISCVALPESLPGGVRAILAENLLASMLNLEVASGNDALASHSDIRKTAKLMCQFIPGTDFVHSGYSSMPRYDNMFGGGCFDATEYDDYNVIQRDMQIDAGLRPVREEQVLTIRTLAGRAIQAVYAGMGFPEITDEEIDAATSAMDSRDMPVRNVVADLAAADAFLADDRTVVDVIRALDAGGFTQVAERLLELGRQRVMGDYLQPSAIFDADFGVQSGINDANDYQGPGSGYRLQGEAWEAVKDLPQAKEPADYLAGQGQNPSQLLREMGPAAKGGSGEVVVAVGPAFGQELTQTINDIPHDRVLQEVLTGIAEEGLSARIVKVHQSADCAYIGYAGAQLSGSGIAIGIQSRGTTVIHRSDLAPLNNLELFSQSPNLRPESFRQIGRNAARYAKQEAVEPVPVNVDNWVRLRLIVKTMLLHHRECEQVDADKSPSELFFDWEPEIG
jgi:propanediol dehydratase large subunit